MARVRVQRVGKRSYLRDAGGNILRDERGKMLWVPCIAEIWRVFDDSVILGRDPLGAPIYRVTGFEVIGSGPEKLDLSVVVGQESARRFTDDGVVNLPRISQPTTAERLLVLGNERPIPRSLSDFAIVAGTADNSGPIAVPSFTPGNGNIVILSAALHAIAGGSGISVSGAAGLSLSQIQSDMATVSGSATGFGGVWWGVGQGAAVTDLQFTLDGGNTNVRGSYAIVEASGQDASPILQSTTAAGDSSDVNTASSGSATLGASPQATSAIVTNMFRADTPAITEGSGYTMLYEIDSAAGSNDFLHHVAFDRTSPTNPPAHSWTGTRQWDLVVSEVEEAAAAGALQNEDFPESAGFGPPHRSPPKVIVYT